jgi:flagellin
MVDALNNSTGVLGVLRQLQSASSDLSIAQSRVSSGQLVESAKDNAPFFQIASSMKGERGALQAVTLSLGRAQSISDTSIAAAEKLSSQLRDLQEVAVRAQGQDLSDEQRSLLNTQFHDMLQQMDIFVSNATFDGANLIDGSKPGGVQFIADADATQSLTLAGRNLKPGGAIVTIGQHFNLATSATALNATNAINESIENLGRQLADMAAENKRVTDQMGFVGKLADVLASGIGNLVDADMGLESARIQALKLKQSLSSEAISIANAAPQALLSMLRS